MASTPVDDHTEEFEQLAGLVALDVLDGEELARFEQHAAHCERCRVTVRLDREALARAAPEMDPSPDFKARLMQRAARELAATAEAEAPGTEPIPLRPAPPPNVVPLWRRFRPWLSAIAAVIVLGVVGLGGYSYQNQVVASYTLSGSLAGSAVVNVRRSGAAELALRGVASPPPGFVYEAWVIPPGSSPVPVGVTDSGTATMPLSGLTSGATVAITRERQRVEAPTDLPPPLSVTVQS